MLCTLCHWYMCDRWVLSRCDLIDQVFQKREQSARESETFLNQGSLASPRSWREGWRCHLCQEKAAGGVLESGMGPRPTRTVKLLPQLQGRKKRVTVVSGAEDETWDGVHWPYPGLSFGL